MIAKLILISIKYAKAQRLSTGIKHMKILKRK